MSKPAGVEAHPVIGVLIAPPKLPKVHLTEDNKQTSCGRVVTVLVPYRAFGV